MEYRPELIIVLLEFVIGSIIVLMSGNAIVKLSEKFLHPHQLKMPIIGILLLPIMTSLPHLFMSISSVVEGVPDFVYLGGFGILIANLTLVLGFTALFGKKFTIKHRLLVKRDAFSLTITVLISIFLMVDGFLDRFDGFVLIFLFTFYIFNLHHEEKSTTRNVLRKLAKKKILLFTAVSLILMFFGSALISRGAKTLIIESGLSTNFIGVILVGAAIAVPQMFIMVMAHKRGKIALSFSNLIMEILISLPLIIGLVAIFNPLPINLSTTRLLLPIVGGLTVFFGIVFWSNPFQMRMPREFNIKKHEALFLILLYIVIAVIVYR